MDKPINLTIFYFLFLEGAPVRPLGNGTVYLRETPPSYQAPPTLGLGPGPCTPEETGFWIPPTDPRALETPTVSLSEKMWGKQAEMGIAKREKNYLLEIRFAVFPSNPYYLY